MNIHIWLFVLFAALMMSCISNSDKQMETSASVDKRTKDSLAISETISGFLSWYKTNYDSATSFRWVTSDAKGYYLVNAENCEAWLKFLAASGFLTENYLNDWRRYFELESANLREHPQNEGPPEGFNMDLVLWTQEPELTLDSLKSLRYRMLHWQADSATIAMENYNALSCSLVKKDGTWRISRITPSDMSQR